MSKAVQRPIALVVLLALGFLSLPVAAYFLDGPRTENLIVPIQLAAMGVIGALVGRLLPGLAGPEAKPGRAVLIGAGVGLLMAVVGIVIFFFLLSGLTGA